MLSDSTRPLAPTIAKMTANPANPTNPAKTPCPTTGCGCDRHGGGSIRIRGARQNNLKNLSLDIATGELLVVTGVSGSGKSSLVFDTLYAEGQRRYVETFSPYARQFLDRMDKPQVDRIDGVPPAIAIDQTNPVRTSRSTVGTMTELNDHLKLLYARCATLYCPSCARPVQRDTVATIGARLRQLAAIPAADDPAPALRVAVCFPVAVPANFSAAEVEQFLNAQGYVRVQARSTTADGGLRLSVVQDRFDVATVSSERLGEALEAALTRGHGHLEVHRLDEQGTVLKFNSRLACAECGIDYADPTPGLFSFNSPLGACETCRGFGRVIGVDLDLVIPDPARSLREGAVRPWQTKSFGECQDDMVRYAEKAGIALDVPWRDLPPEQRRWVIEGGADWTGKWRKQWYGISRFFDWLETKAYRMHIRVLLSKYRSYTECPACQGARLRPAALAWRLGAAPGLNIHQLQILPIERAARWLDDLALPAPLDTATGQLRTEITARIRFLLTVGLGYLTLERQSRTLSGGEVQRINLTTALGTSLVNTLFVLDEPSIGLHPRDIGRIIEVMERLRSAGNTIVVVEHDPQMMAAADRVLDIGPGPGERGGEIVFHGSPAELRAAPTLTGDYLAGRRQVTLSAGRAVRANTPRLIIEGARAHNLRDLSVEIPLGRMVVLTGVSGSGKSTLMQQVLLPALTKALGGTADQSGRFAEAAGPCRRLLGADWIGEVVSVDQAAIGRTTRSNPVSYVGAFEGIRKLFAAHPLAIERRYLPGTFSFNAGKGRCPACGGTGFEHVEMQFLSDVYLRCPDCDGKRFRPSVLEVRLSRPAARRADGSGFGLLSIADVLDLTVNEALQFFAGEHEIARRLAPLREVGLDYLRLGQPVPTLSGGEAQRLKLAGHLAGVRSTRRATPRLSGAWGEVGAGGTLFLFDEPTTGLHFDDIARLLRAFSKLLAAGHSLLIIEHNLDVIRSADWIIDLGPEGGEAGGELVAVGSPEAIAAEARSHTGRALRALSEPGAPPETAPATGTEPADSDSALRALARDAIVVHHAREHNLKNIDVAIPRDRMTVITGVSGSGKSTLAFDVIFAEGQRRYLESLNAYARQFVAPAARPDVDSILGIPPTVAIEQRASRGGRKSTVATLTEIYHFLRLLYVRLGIQHCPQCAVAIEPQSFESIAAQIERDYRGRHIGLLAPLVVARKGLYSELARWAQAHGYSHLQVDGAFVPTATFPRLARYVEHDIALPVADLVVDPAQDEQLRAALARALEHGQGAVIVAGGLERLRAAIDAGDATGASAALETRLLSTRRACPSCGTSFPELDPRLFSFNSRLGWCPSCFGTGVELAGFDAEQTGEEGRWSEGGATCRACAGTRLNPSARAVRLGDFPIATVTALPVSAAREWAQTLALSARAGEIARDALAEIATRLAFLEDVGLGYLSLDRSAPTLSGGEAQRIRLAAQLGSNLQGVCYILDEPTIGLHPRDNNVLLDTLEALRDRGNTLLVVEHDEDTIRRADHVIDMGPAAGRHGGEIVATGTLAQLCRNPASVTGRYLAAPLAHDLHPRRGIDAATPTLRLRGASEHNLRGLDLDFALGRITVVTGVSGSGKSTLARDVLLANLAAQISARNRRLPPPPLNGVAALEGWQEIDAVLEVDQTPIGATPRSCPATYVGFWDTIRRLFADTAEARLRGYAAGRFSFNTTGGRCPVCEGRGEQTVEMSFLPDVKVRCEACNGERFGAETLAVRLRGRSIGEILAASVDEALEFFAAHPPISRPLQLLQDVGLGYLTLGQPSPTLSGGEAQRIKLVTELAKVRASPAGPGRGRAPHTLYVLDEPTVGLHMADIDRLLGVLHRLVDAGNTLVVVEHNLDIWAQADWIIDLGPEGGGGGGRLVAQGTPRELAGNPASHTGRALAAFLANRAALPNA